MTRISGTSTAMVPRVTFQTVPSRAVARGGLHAGEMFGEIDAEWRDRKRLGRLFGLGRFLCRGESQVGEARLRDVLGLIPPSRQALLLLEQPESQLLLE